MERLRRLVTLLAALTIMMFGLAVSPASAASPEGEVLSLINAERVVAGLAPLRLNVDLADDAEAQSRRMMERGALFHNPNLGTVTTGWDELNENVGVGGTVASLHAAFMASSSHRANILGNYDYVGVGVAAESDSKIWVTVVFMRALPRAPAPTDQPTPYASVKLVAPAHSGGATNPPHPRLQRIGRSSGARPFLR